MKNNNLNMNELQKEKVGVVLIKFGSPEFMKKLYEEGEMCLNTVSYFKKLEDKKLRGDRDENITQNLQPDNVTVEINGRQLKDFAGSIRIYVSQEDKYKTTHIYSMSVLCVGDEINNDKIFDDQIKDFGSEAVMIFNIKEFISRIEKASEKLINDSILQAFVSDAVTYFDLNKHHGEMDVFSKSHEYSYQKEWRLGMKFINFLEPFFLKIGNISDIAALVKSEDFCNGSIKFS